MGTLAEKDMMPSESRDEVEKPATAKLDGGVEFDIVADDGSVLMRNNRLTIDDTSRQALSMEEIGELKKASASSGSSGRDIIQKIMDNHSALNEKTSFSLAKYTLRKSRKYMKRFTILQMDVNILTEIVLEKEHGRIMELRRDLLGLITNWANVHAGVQSTACDPNHGIAVGGGRWLVVEDTSGLIVAAMAERMGILYPKLEVNTGGSSSQAEEAVHNGVIVSPDKSATTSSNRMDIDQQDALKEQDPSERIGRSRRHELPIQLASHSTITVILPNSQGNLSLLKHFGYSTEDPSPSHPLHSHLKTLTWLQLLEPEADQLCHEPPRLSEDELSQLKSGKRGTYWRKRRRWERVRRVVNETQGGGFDGLVIASTMKAQGILNHLVPLVRGGGQIVVYSPTVEPLTELMDLYSRERKAAYVRMQQHQRQHSNGIEQRDVEDDDFPVNPTLLLNPMLQTSRARHWQVLPGRTHPLMTSRGGSEGYVFTATRVLPATAWVAARGKFAKKKKADEQAKTADEAAAEPVDIKAVAKRPAEEELHSDRPLKAASVDAKPETDR